MNTGSARLRRDRNHAVFRSAERLIATTASKPKRRRPSRGFAFAAGLAIGIAIGLGVFLAWRSEGDGTRPTSAALATKLAAASPARRATTTQSVTAPSAAGEAVPQTAPLSADAVSAPRSDTSIEQRWRATMDGFIARSPSTAVTNAQPVASGLTRFVAAMALRGNITIGRQKLPIGFILYRVADGRGTGVIGTSRIVEPGSVVVASRINGFIVGNTVTLQETEPLPGNRSGNWIGRSYVLRLTSSSTTQQITGRWTYGGSSGGVSVELAPVW